MNRIREATESHVSPTLQQDPPHLRGPNFLEDLAVVLGGALVIAGAWIIYWPAGLIAAGAVTLVIAIVHGKHRTKHGPGLVIAIVHGKHRTKHGPAPPPTASNGHRLS